MTTMKKISRNIVVGLIFSAAGFVAVSAVPASAATTTAAAGTSVQSATTTTSFTTTKASRVWEW
jgi:hypothetical protein